MEKKDRSSPSRNPGRNLPPAVYRPVAPVSQAKSASTSAPGVSSAPPAYRPFTATSQLKPAITPPVYRPAPGASQPKNASSFLARSGAPPIYCPQTAVQRYRIPGATAPSAFRSNSPIGGYGPETSQPGEQLRQAAQPKTVQLRNAPSGAAQPPSIPATAPVVQRFALPATTVIQRSPSMRTLDANLAGIKNNTRAYPGISDASPSDKAPGFTYKGKTYHFTFIPDIYHLTDEADGKHHYFFKFGAEGLEDIHKFPHSTSRKGHDHPLSDLADKDLLKFVQRLFTKTLLHPTALAVKLEQKEKTQKLANELWETGGYNTYADAYADARNA
jgi:hypothetical protein